MKISEFVKNGKGRLVTLFLAGIILIGVSYIDIEKKDTAKEVEEVTVQKMEAYTEDLEQKVSDLLNSMEGISEVKVMITLKNGTEKILKEDTESTRTRQEKKEEQEDEEAMKKTTVILQGEEEKPYVVQEIYPQIQGIAISGKGISEQSRKKEILDMMQALFDIPIHKIAIMEK
ncbi:MAG: hypothetical protein K6G64_03770 [Eubacterium sp.]|nr:hypothetical protein [Eubacterium sp.]